MPVLLMLLRGPAVVDFRAEPGRVTVTLGAPEGETRAVAPAAPVVGVEEAFPAVAGVRRPLPAAEGVAEGVAAAEGVLLAGPVFVAGVRATSAAAVGLAALAAREGLMTLPLLPEPMRADPARGEAAPAPALALPGLLPAALPVLPAVVGLPIA